MILTDRQVEILRLRFLEERTYAEIAATLDVQPIVVVNEEAEALETLVKRYLLLQEAAS